MLGQMQTWTEVGITSFLHVLVGKISQRPQLVFSTRLQENDFTLNCCPASSTASRRTVLCSRSGFGSGSQWLFLSRCRSQPRSKYFLPPPTKLREGNVFTGVCHSVQGRGGVSHVTIIHDVLGLTVHGSPNLGPPQHGTLLCSPPQRQPSPSDMGPLSTPPQPWLCPPYMGSHCTGCPNPVPPPTSNIWWPSLDICSKVFTSGPPPPPRHLMAIETHTVGKWAVHILLECFLVIFSENWHK